MRNLTLLTTLIFSCSHVVYDSSFNIHNALNFVTFPGRKKLAGRPHAAQGPRVKYPCSRGLKFLLNIYESFGCDLTQGFFINVFNKK